METTRRGKECDAIRECDADSEGRVTRVQWSKGLEMTTGGQ